ncbi:unnamed protein product [Ostreobium quekettii]|uniref:Transmembrane 9 superfamily member n=1 Tax=Ostreobium quekettii TaxID=121088 RepID=A0A8S1JFH6_9CHLO|nr:unnamed protein product [Ostreobium quekettii]
MQFKFLQEQQCTVACRKTLTKDEVKNFRAKIDDEYRVNMIFDNLPVGILREVKNLDANGDIAHVYDRGFPVGYHEKGRYILFNHLRFTVHHHFDPKRLTSRVVGFEVTPISVHHKAEDDTKTPPLRTCRPQDNVLTFETERQDVVEKEVIFTYDVLFKDSEVRWASRWDSYLAFRRNDQIHWFSIINSLMIVIFLSGMVAMIMLRTLHRDIAKYNQLETVEEAQEESGWKLVHGDVFRPPGNSSWLAVHVGVGVQLFGSLIVAIFFALLGFLSPANRGSLMTAILVLFVFMGFFAGFYSSRLYKTFKGSQWKTTTIRTAFFFPGLCFAIFFVLNLLIWGQKSSGAVPFGTLFALCCLWFGISAPLVFIGSYLGFKKTPQDDPVRTNKIPRQIPEQPLYMHPVLSCLIGGLLPFGAVFIELFFILTSIWLHQFYYIFGFLTLVFIILIFTCAEITIVLCYFQLCSEDYHWWWRSFFTAGSSALYLFLYSAYYFYTKLDISKTVSAMLYFGYMGILSYGFFCVTGTIGFYACHWFVHKIYGAVKFD